jgi:hypothetical protein
MSVVNRRRSSRACPPEAEIIAAIYAHHGILSPTAKALGLARSSLDRMVQRRSRLAYACRQARETLIDFTESKLYECISEKRERSIIFALSSPLARQRGWGSATDEGGGGANTMLIGKVIVNAIETGKFIDADDQLTIEGESVDGGIVHDVQTRKLA